MSNITLKQARSDLKYMQDKYGDANDYCGSFCNTEKLEAILFGKATIKETVIENIEYYFSNGIDNCMQSGCTSNIRPDLFDKRTNRIVKRYVITVKLTF